MLIANWQNQINVFAECCEWVGVREYRELTDTLVAKNGKGESSHRDVSHGLMIEVLLHGQFAYAATTDLSEVGIQQAFSRALDLAHECSKYALNTFTDSLRPANSGHYKTSAQQTLDSYSMGDIHRRLIRLSSELNAGEDIADAWAYARLVSTQIFFQSSNGSQWQQDFTIVSKDFGVTAEKGGVLQSRSLGLSGRQCGIEVLDEINFQTSIKESAQRIVKQARDLVLAPECPSDTRDLILMPDQLYLQVHESVGHPLELDRILGDERNYAGWSFISPDDFGHLQYGAELMNISFDPTASGAMASYAFDDNGVAANKEYLIKNGRLLRGIGGVESQQRLALPGVACARASDWNRPPMDRMANINMEPGSSTLEEMIAATEKGILMATNRSWSIDDYRNKFQFGCEYGQLIENGRLTQLVKNPNYKGVTKTFWHNLKMVGDNNTLEVCGSPYCGKGEPNQIIRVGHTVPACLFKDIEIFGGA